MDYLEKAPGEISLNSFLGTEPPAEHICRISRLFIRYNLPLSQVSAGPHVLGLHNLTLDAFLLLFYCAHEIMWLFIYKIFTGIIEHRMLPGVKICLRMGTGPSTFFFNPLLKCCR